MPLQQQRPSLDEFYQNGQLTILYRVKSYLRGSILANYTITEWGIGTIYSIRGNY